MGVRETKAVPHGHSATLKVTNGIHSTNLNTTKTKWQRLMSINSLILAVTVLILATGFPLRNASILSYLASTAHPPPSPLPPQNIKDEFTLVQFVVPQVLLFLVLLIPAKARWERYTLTGLVVPAILWMHYISLSAGSRSSAFGLAIGECYGSYPFFL